jgi:hypothetical protein
MPQLEVGMAKQQTSFRRVESLLGAALLVLGVFFLFTNVDALTASVSRTAGHSQEDASSALLGLALAGLHATQAYAFDRAHFLSALHGILVSFWPLALVFVGVLLMRDFFAGCFAAYKARVAFEKEETVHE